VLDLWPALWNFTEHSDVDATNNRAEVRHEVARFKWIRREEGWLMLAA
jgi:hypothetical protein